MNEPTGFYAAVYVPEFPAQAALRLRPELRKHACVVLEGDPPLESVCSLNRRARAQGASHGMTRSDVETMPQVSVLSRSLREEESTAAALLECAGGFSPRLEDHRTGYAFACVLDIAGTEKLFGPPQRLAHTLHKQLRSLHIAACIATSSNVPASLALARSLSLRSPILHVAANRQCEALSGLPLSVIDLCAEQAQTFALWGIDTLGMLAELPEKELIARLGRNGKHLRDLARGDSPHLFQPIEPPFQLEEHLELDTPVELLDSLLFVLAGLLDQLILRAASRFVALTSVTITLRLEGELIHTRKVRPALPCNERALWLKLLQLDLETHPPAASIVSLTMAAEHGSTAKVQLGLFSPQLPESSRLDVTLARIARIVGEEHVGRAVLQDSHRPDGFAIDSFHIAATSRTTPPPQRTDSAVRQLRPHEDVAISFSENRPNRMRFRNIEYSIQRAYGPWLTGGEWWNAATWNIEQWDIVARDDGGTLLCGCLARDLLQDKWAMTSLYD